MRTAHILKRSAKGEVKLLDDGRFTPVSDKYKSLTPDAGETIELWTSGANAKIKKGIAPKKKDKSP